MKPFVTILLVLFCTSVFAQYPQASVTDVNVKVRADKITAEYNKHLGLNGIQIPLFKNAVARYLVLADDVKKRKQGRAALDDLIEIQTNETSHMNDILTLYQLRLYRRLKSEIQPLDIMDDPVEEPF